MCGINKILVLESWRRLFFQKVRLQIKDNNNSPHDNFHRFLFPLSSKCPDLNFAPYVIHIYETRMWLKVVSLGYLWFHVLVSYRSGFTTVLPQSWRFYSTFLETSCKIKRNSKPPFPQHHPKSRMKPREEHIKKTRHCIFPSLIWGRGVV